MSNSRFRLTFSRIAATAVITITISAMTAAQPTKPESSSVADAVKANNRLFGLYMFVLAAGAALSYFVWASGNKVQDAVRADALARIEEAKKDAGTANVEAAKAHEAAGKANQLAEEAHERAERLELEAAQQRERAARAEKDLELVKDHIKDRDFTGEEWGTLLVALKDAPKCPVDVILNPGNDEVDRFAQKLLAILQMAGWRAMPTQIGAPPLPTGIGVSTPDGKATICSTALVNAFASIGMEVRTFVARNFVRRPEGSEFMELLVGPKPSPR